MISNILYKFPGPEPIILFLDLGQMIRYYYPFVRQIVMVKYRLISSITFSSYILRMIIEPLFIDHIDKDIVQPYTVLSLPRMALYFLFTLSVIMPNSLMNME